MQVKIEKSWERILKKHFEKESFHSLADFVKKEYLNAKVRPEPKNLFRAFALCPFDKTKVVILGQDPYHGENQADGLCFSVPPETKIPPSLKNIFKELSSDLKCPERTNPDLQDWASQGVLLLNSVLTVRLGSPTSHANYGWEDFTDFVIKSLSEKKENLVFILWGAYAKSKTSLIDSEKHLILTSAHPSPFSAHKGFFGSKVFSKTNEYLKKHGLDEIKWF